MTAEQIRPVAIEEDEYGRGAVFDVPFIGRVTVWADEFEVVPAEKHGNTWSASPEDVEEAARHLMAAAAWMRKENGR